MPTVQDHPMADKRQEVSHVLDKAREEDIEIVQFTDEMIIRIKVRPQPAPSEKKGKWAQVAEKLAKENLLRDGLGDELREHARQFRKTFVLK